MVLIKEDSNLPELMERVSFLKNFLFYILKLPAYIIELKTKFCFLRPRKVTADERKGSERRKHLPLALTSLGNLTPGPGWPHQVQRKLEKTNQWKLEVRLHSL